MMSVISPIGNVILKSMGVNFFGQESIGSAQIRGNGTLILHENALYFKRWAPKKEFIIPISKIEAIETPRSHLGKHITRPLLKVVFINESGQYDSIAWWVRKLDKWILALEGLIQRQG